MEATQIQYRFQAKHGEEAEDVFLRNGERIRDEVEAVVGQLPRLLSPL